MQDVHKKCTQNRPTESIISHLRLRMPYTQIFVYDARTTSWCGQRQRGDSIHKQIKVLINNRLPIKRQITNFLSLEWLEELCHAHEYLQTPTI